MSLIFMDGFDNYNAVTDLVAGPFSTQSVTGYVSGRTSPGKAVNLGSSTGYITKSGFIGSSVRTITMGFAVSQYAVSGLGPLLQVAGFYTSGGNNTNITVTFEPNGSVVAGSTAYLTNYSDVPSGFGTALGTPASDNHSGNWHYIEVQMTSGTSLECSLSVKLDGVNILALKNLTFGFSTWSGFEIACFTGGYSPNVSGTGLLTYIDDLYFCDDQGSNPTYTTFLGVCSIQTLFPTGAGTYTEFAPVPVNNANWQNVSETADDGDDTYNTASNPGTKDTFVSNGSFTTSQTILAVQPKISVRQDDTSTRMMQTYVISNTTAQGGANTTLTTAYQFASDIYVNDPNTGEAWTGPGVNDLEFGYNITE